MLLLKLYSQLLLLPILVLVFLVVDAANGQGLKLGFYAKSCPKEESIIHKTVASYVSFNPTFPSALLRMHFHDCFVRGCDGSVLLNSTSTNQTEKAAIPNLSLRGFNIIDAPKAAIEKVCPGVVSCADILALSARDSVAMIKGPWWNVPTGRRDGRVSTIGDAFIHLPPPFFNVTQLKASFSSKGLNAKDLAVLSGGHTIGIANCAGFSQRLYNFTGKGDTDPTLDSEYVPRLKSKCKPNDFVTTAEMDPGSFKTFDSSYYKLVAKRRGLLTSDAALLNDPETKAYVRSQARNNGPTFFKDFAVSMEKINTIEVLTGNAGEIRKHCAFIN
ncbi:peroxidase 27-like [Papaver somniferum]|uniref:peroxidase 27-like n=1 Tax=Papaver somniferum TaxID=3469 RepID=UPI000E6FF943|nr:peroxidase 27-like [Papaver somniferum]